MDRKKKLRLIIAALVAAALLAFAGRVLLDSPAGSRRQEAERQETGK